MKSRMTGDLWQHMGQELLADGIAAALGMEITIMPDDYIIPAEFQEEHAAYVAKQSGIGTNAIGAVSYTNHCNEEKEGKIMATVVKKSDLRFVDGYLTMKDGTIVSPGFTQAYIELEGFLQRAAYENALPKPADRFIPESNFEDRLIAVPEPKTPTLDEDAKHADLVGAEAKLIIMKTEAEKVLDEFHGVVEFVCGNTVVLYDQDYHATIIDTPMLGNPLELKKNKLLELVCEAVEYPLG